MILKQMAMNNEKKIIVLDRDGVINRDSDDYIKSTDEWQPIPGSLAAIASLYKAGYRVFVFTNQSGVARGYFSEEVLAQIHQKMVVAVEALGGKIEKIFYCPHGPNDNCDCRKPKPGMLRQLELYLNDTLENAIVVGDSMRDIDAGIAVKAEPFLVSSGKSLQMSISELTEKKIKVFDNLLTVSEFLLEGRI